VSCPFFLPTQPANDIAFPHPARLPLGAAWRGSCQSPGQELHVLGNQELESCNLGHAHACPRLPKERSCDSVRFAISRHSQQAVSVQFVLESKHLPIDSGLLEYDRVSGSWVSLHAEQRIQKLAASFLQAYLGRIERV
jgi:hypothetical protein